MEAGRLAPPTLQVNTRLRALSEAETITSQTSNPFLFPVSPSNASTSGASTELRNDPNAKVVNNPFAFTPSQLNRLLNPKSLTAFRRALGGVEGIAAGLQTKLQSELSPEDPMGYKDLGQGPSM
jgi:Ca2+-transporting ATPase